MPTLTKRKKLTRTLLIRGFINTLWGSDRDVSSSLFETSLLYLLLENTRYLSPRSTSIPKCKFWYEKVLPHYDNYRYKCTLRVSREDFAMLWDIIKDNPVFKCKGKTEMIAVELQLAIALYRFGCDGTGSSYVKVGQLFGIGDGGTIRNCTDRVIQSVLELAETYIKWPDVNERENIANHMEDMLPKCIGYLDGCHIGLYQAPVDDHESYFSRKQEYSINLQAICDHNLLLRQITVGFPGSVHDARVFANSFIGQFPERFLSSGQWLAADSAYKLDKYVITPYRKNTRIGTATKREQKRFNRYFSGYRVRIEQSFGILKNVFSSLRKLRIRVDRLSGHRRACEWIVACCILYNILQQNGSFANESFDFEEENNVHNENDAEDNTTEGEAKRNALMNWIITP